VGEIKVKELDINFSDFINTNFSLSGIGINDSNYYDYFRKFKIIFLFFLNIDTNISLTNAYSSLFKSNINSDKKNINDSYLFFLNYCEELCYDTKELKLVNYNHITIFFKRLLTQALDKNLIEDKNKVLEEIQQALKSSLSNFDLNEEYREINKIYSFLEEVNDFIKDNQEEMLKCQENNIMIAKKGKIELSSKITDIKLQFKLWDYINYNIGLNDYIIHSSLLDFSNSEYPKNYLDSLEEIKEENKKTIISFQSQISSKNFSNLLLSLLIFLGFNYRFIHNILYSSELDQNIKKNNSADDLINKYINSLNKN